jgi:hypothetical protein
VPPGPLPISNSMAIKDRNRSSSVRPPEYLKSLSPPLKALISPALTETCSLHFQIFALFSPRSPQGSTFFSCPPQPWSVQAS